MENDCVETTLFVKLKNVSDKQLQSSIKVRLLYLVSDSSASLELNGSHLSFNRKNPRIPISLKPGEELTLNVKAKQGIEYNLDALKKEENGRTLDDDEEGKKKKKFSLNDLAKLFDSGNFGKRFLVGQLISKWGIFPLEFKSVKIEIHTPSDFEGIFAESNSWQLKKKSNGNYFICENTSGFQGTVFLPKKDVEQYRLSLPKQASQSAEIK
ncbi:MAG: hypothetical protein HQM08_03840 [Candidatus Riflebacteria bacterium]|nr:hypothetical protein [Candidatus Riflebacteria bacterium]